MRLLIMFVNCIALMYCRNYLCNVSYVASFQEAAIYLNEGIRNEKFTTHPSTKYTYYGYLILHHPLYYTMFPLVGILLLLLTLFEEPTFVTIPPKVNVYNCLLHVQL